MAIARAPIILGFKPDDTTSTDEPLPIGQAFLTARNQTNRRASSLIDWDASATRFMTWLSGTHLRAKDWQNVTREIVLEYRQFLKSKAANTQRIYLNPICQTSRYWADVRGYRDVARNLKLSHCLKTAPAEVDLPEILSLLDWLRDFRGKEKKSGKILDFSRLEIGIALQALAGLRVTEVLRLTFQHVDLRHGTVCIDGETKNSYSARIIPVPKRAMEALQRVVTVHPCPASSYPVMTTVLGTPYAHHNHYRNAVERALETWCRETGKTRPAWKVKDLRNLVPTLAVLKGFYGETVEQFLGHSPRGVTARHYLPRLATLGKGVFRSGVVCHIDAAVTTYYNQLSRENQQPEQNQASA